MTSHGLKDVTSFKIKAAILIAAALLLWAAGAERRAAIAVLLPLAGVLALAHPWKASGNQPLDPRLVACMILAAAVFGWFLSVALSMGVPNYGPYTDGIGRAVVNIPDPNINIQLPLNGSNLTPAAPVAAPPGR